MCCILDLKSSSLEIERRVWLAVATAMASPATAIGSDPGGWSDGSGEEGWPESEASEHSEMENGSENESEEESTFHYESCKWWADYILSAVPRPEFATEPRPLNFESACAGLLSEGFIFEVVGNGSSDRGSESCSPCPNTDGRGRGGWAGVLAQSGCPDPPIIEPDGRGTCTGRPVAKFQTLLAQGQDVAPVHKARTRAHRPA